jgi:hypothetical protein
MSSSVRRPAAIFLRTSITEVTDGLGINHCNTKRTIISLVSSKAHSDSSSKALLPGLPPPPSVAVHISVRPPLHRNHVIVNLLLDLPEGSSRSLALRLDGFERRELLEDAKGLDDLAFASISVYEMIRQWETEKRGKGGRTSVGERVLGVDDMRDPTASFKHSGNPNPESE